MTEPADTIGGRLKQWLHALLIAIDQLAYVLLDFWACVVRAHRVPSPRETISSKVGRMANEGREWAIVVQPMIDRLFELFGSPPGHCQRAIVDVVDQ